MSAKLVADESEALVVYSMRNPNSAVTGSENSILVVSQFSGVSV